MVLSGLARSTWRCWGGGVNRGRMGMVFSMILICCLAGKWEFDEHETLQTYS